jgi:pantoate--beta-alanine ligase
MSKPPFVARTVSDLRRHVDGWHGAGETVGLVPTMGALHEGHISLLRLAQTRTTRSITSIFVNPAQFAPNEDFDKYPRTWDDDIAQLTRAGCDLVWAPTPSEMYPEGFATHVIPGGAAEGLETDFRPHFFRGVATVCCKLFTQSRAEVAVFGEKDFQQLAVIRQMVRDLNLPLDIVPGPTVREADGLAMSSRNRNLTADHRAAAVILHRVLTDIAAVVRAQDNMAAVARAEGKIDAATLEGKKAITAAGFTKVDYLCVRDAETLKTFLAAHNRPARVLVAAWLGQTRLIDNVAV